MPGSGVGKDEKAKGKTTMRENGYDLSNLYELFDTLSQPIAAILRRIPDYQKANIQEIRLRCGQSVAVYLEGRQWFVSKEGMLCRMPEQGSQIGAAELDCCFKRICNYSVHTHMRELCEGFVTLKGGHRVGVCATAVMEQGQIVSIRELSSLNIRVARQVFGCANEILHYIEPDSCPGLLVVGPPGSGKTTVIRDLARQLAGGYHGECKKVVIVDERSEIAASWGGCAQMQVGTADVLNGYRKGEGMLLAIRSLSPDFLFCDELGRPEEVYALGECVHCGVRVIATAHATSLTELISRPGFSQLLATRAFKKVILLDSARSPSSVKKIWDIGEILAGEEKKAFVL